MSLTESIVEDAALEWSGEQSRFARPLTQPLPRGEEKREAIRGLNPAITEEARATIRQFRIVHTERRIKL